MVFHELKVQHLGKGDDDFPFNATDMARFIIRTLKKTLPEIPDEVQPHEENVQRFVQSPPCVLQSEIVELKAILRQKDLMIKDMKQEMTELNLQINRLTIR